MELHVATNLENAKRCALEAEARVVAATGRPGREQVIFYQAARALALCAQVWATLHETERD